MTNKSGVRMHPKKKSGRRRLAAGALSLAAVGGTLAGVSPAEASTNHTTFTVRIENVSNGFEFSQSGAFAHPNNGDAPGPAFPGDFYEFHVNAHPGQNLSFATMLVQSNDWFFAPGEEGISLYDADGHPISGDITSYVNIYDSGTEIDQPVGEGPDQAPRQSGPDTGAEDPNPIVRSVTSLGDSSQFINVTATPGENGMFTIRVTNISGDSSVPGPIAPGVYTVGEGEAPLFQTGEHDRGEGLEGLAEDGAVAPFAEALGLRTGTATPIAPVFYAATWWERPIFTSGQTMNGLGIEVLAEDGSPVPLASGYATRPFGDVGAQPVAVGAEGPGPAFPGDVYEFTVTAEPTQPLHFATMFVQSNDWFFSPSENGIHLFDENGHPISGDISHLVNVYDAGTEIDQTPGFGPDQAPRQAGPNTGAADPINHVRGLDIDASGYVKVTITPAG